MKFLQKRKKAKQQAKLEKKTKQLMLLDEALKKIVSLGIAVLDDGVYRYSTVFEGVVQREIVDNPPSRLTQLKMGGEARKLVPQMLAMAVTRPSRRDIENLITAYFCLRSYVNSQALNVEKKFLPDLAYAVWYLNDHNPTVEEVNEWVSISPT